MKLPLPSLSSPEPFLNPSISSSHPHIPLSSPMALLLLFLLCSLISISSISASEPNSQALIFPLTHALSHSHTLNSTHHLLKSASLTSAARHRSRRREQQRLHVSLPLTPGSDYTLSLSLSPTTTISLYMDTGSDLLWFPCSPFECILCEGKPGTTTTPPPPPPPTSSPLPCSSPFCSAAHSSLPSSDLCAVAACPLSDIETSSCRHSPCPPLYYAYGDGSLIAHLRRGPLSLPSAASSPLTLKDFTFACAHSALAEPVGVAGFGGGALSLPAQLAARHPSLAARFSYCLVSHSYNPGRLRRPSPLILGRSPTPSPSPFIYTPILSNPKHPYFYSVGLESISVGGIRVPARPELAAVDSNGNGGMVVDSGTTYTMLPDEMHKRVVREFDAGMRAAGFKRSPAAEEKTGMGLCYGYAGGRDGRRVPGVTLEFSGNASVVMPRRNYFLGFEEGGEKVGCLMLMSAGEEEDAAAGGGGPAATLGNYQQQGFEVAYDLEERRIGFARRRCAEMWKETVESGG